MANYELIIEALKLYREKLQSDVTDMISSGYNIDMIIIVLQELNNLLNEYSSVPLLPDTGEELIYNQYYDLALRYNTLYFRLMDICR